jgi:hypothetical protein
MEPETEVIEMDSPPPSTALVPQLPAVGLEVWEPAALRATMAREIALREVMTEYMRAQMKRGHHYYLRSDLGGGSDEERRGGGDRDAKPSLTKEGALNLSHLLQCRPASPEVFETWHEDGHYTVRTRVKLVSLRSGDVMGEGDGLCSTRESKYAYRWVPEWQVPEAQRQGLPWREIRIKTGARAGQKMRLYRLANEQLADLYNTCLKLSYKRALVAGVLTLPLASELFTQDLEDLDNGEDEELGGAEVITPESRRQRLESRPMSPATGEPTWSRADVDRMGSTQVNAALAKRLRYLAPDSRDDRDGYIRLATEEKARSWPGLEALGLSVRKGALLTLLHVKKDAPPADAEPDDVPLDPEAETEASQPEPPPSPPELILVEGYAGLESVQALRVWATALGARLALETELARGGADASGPLVTSEQWERCVLAVQAAATPGEEDVP